MIEKHMGLRDVDLDTTGKDGIVPSLDLRRTWSPLPLISWIAQQCGGRLLINLILEELDRFEIN